MAKGVPITLYERQKIEVWLRMRKKKAWIARKLNNRPRKKLNYLTPNEVITKEIDKMGL